MTLPVGLEEYRQRDRNPRVEAAICIRSEILRGGGRACHMIWAGDGLA